MSYLLPNTSTHDNNIIPNKMKFLNKFQNSYDQLWKYIIRPIRTPYPQSALGPQIFQQQGIKIKRNSFQLTNHQGNVFYGSHFVPLQSDSYPCVIFMHGNSSNQIQGIDYLINLIANNISLCTFDFSACGNSQGQYISLGYHEWRDLEEVVKYIKKKQKVTKIAIWGRSMGAVTALRYVSMHDEICAAVYDSPFKSLSSLVTDWTSSNTKIPQFIILGALKIVSSTVKQKAGFRISELNPLQNDLPYIKIPGYFIVGQMDQIVPNQHTKILFQAYPHKNKHINVVQGSHNDIRPEDCITSVIQFLKKALFKKCKKLKKNKVKDKQIHHQKVEADFFDHPKLDTYQIISQKTNDSFSKYSNSNSNSSGCSSNEFKIQNINDMKQFQSPASSSTIDDQIINPFPKNNVSQFNQQFPEIVTNRQLKQSQDRYSNLKMHINSTIDELLKLNKGNISQREKEQRIKKQLEIRDNQFQQQLALEFGQFLW